MTQLTIKVPDTKLSFFIELVQNLGFAEIENNTSQPILTEQQIHLVEIERNKMIANPDAMIDWEQARNMLHTD